MILPFLPLITAGAGAAGAIAKGRSQGRQVQNTANADYDRLQLEGDQHRFDAAKWNAGAPGRRMTDAVRGNILENVQDAGRVGGGRNLQMTGGLRPSLMSQGTRDLGQGVSIGAGGNTAQVDNPQRRAFIEQLASNYDFKPTWQPQPQLRGGKLDSALTGLGMFGTGLDLFKQAGGWPKKDRFEDDVYGR